MNIRSILISLLLTGCPALALALPPGDGFYVYWAEPESLAYISLARGSYEISGKYVAVLTHEEKPPQGGHLLIGELYDCSLMQSALAETISYDASNHAISSYSNENLINSFGTIDEDTRQEFLLLGICNEEKGIPYDLATVLNYFRMTAKSLEATDLMYAR